MGTEALGPWSPLTLDQTVELFREAGFRWWLAGGLALEAHLHRSWRTHDDIDVGIVRADAPQVRHVLAGWDIHLANDGVLTPWNGQPLEGAFASVGNMWCRPTPDAAWALDVLVGEGNTTEWIYKRDPSVRRRWSKAVLRSTDGVPYLAPEIQLLFKSKSGRQKDGADAAAVIPEVTSARRSWLADHLPAGHHWQTIIAGHRAARALRPSDQEPGAVELVASGRSSQAWRSGQSVVRIPIPNSGRLLSYRSESRIGDLLTRAGHPVSRWEVRSVDSAECSIGRYLPGTPIDYHRDWSASFADRLAMVLGDLHALPATGWGPLANTSEELVGTSHSATQGIVDRWFHAPIWPFDGSDLSAHPVVASEPELAKLIASLTDDILGAAGAPFGVVHSDLHREHLLASDGELTGVLDFGDAFVGSTAWDFALIRWYYGASNTERFADAYGSGIELTERGLLLAVAVGCYKVAKSPEDQQARRRLRAILSSIRSS